MNYETKNINRVARKLVNKNWNTKLSIIPGKKLLKELNKWLVKEYKVNFGTIELSTELRAEEMDIELKTVLICIENLKEIKYSL